MKRPRFKPYWLLALLALPLLPSLEVRLSYLEKALLDFDKHLESSKKESENKGEFGSPSMCGGRLTLTSGQPVPVTDPGSQSTIYFSPYKGGRIALFNGVSRWLFDSFTEKALALTGLSSGFNYDVFAYDNTGVVTLDTPVKWTDDTARATSLDILNGIYVKNGAHTRRYLGTFRATDATHTNDSIGTRYVWNQCNRVLRKMTASLPYIDGTAGTLSNISYVAGQAEYTVIIHGVSNETSNSCCCQTQGVAGAIGLDPSFYNPVISAGAQSACGDYTVGPSSLPTYYFGSSSSSIGYHFFYLPSGTRRGSNSYISTGSYDTSNPAVVGIEAFIDG